MRLAGPRRSTTAARDDRAVAGVVGFVLIIAAAITYYSYVAQSEVPREGARGERTWDAELGDAMGHLMHAAGAQAGTDSTVRDLLPEAPDAPTQKIAFLSPLRSARASGTVGFDAACGGATLTHRVSGADVTDAANAAKGCLTFRGEPAYAEGFGYRGEMGGLLRLQSDKAAVLAGPPLTLETVGGRVVASITLVGLRGGTASLGAGSAPVGVELTPRPGALEVVASANAESATWTFTSAHAAAWDAWFDQEILRAGLDPLLNYACAPGDSRCPGLAAGQAQVVLGGAVSSAGAEDLSLSVSQGRYDVSFG